MGCRKGAKENYEMLFIKKLNPNLNTQTDSIRAILFVPSPIVFLVFKYFFLSLFDLIIEFTDNKP